MFIPPWTFVAPVITEFDKLSKIEDKLVEPEKIVSAEKFEET